MFKKTALALALAALVAVPAATPSKAFHIVTGIVVTSIVIGGVAHAIAKERYPEGMDVHAHIRWCKHNTRHFWIHDNTFRPRGGERQTCISPYSP